jgi:hypothetical protein
VIFNEPELGGAGVLDAAVLGGPEAVRLDADLLELPHPAMKSRPTTSAAERPGRTGHF